MLKVVIRPSSVRLADYGCFFGGGASETRGCVGTQLWDTSSWSLWATSVSGLDWYDQPGLAAKFP
jgi:hypothetical protein